MQNEENIGLTTAYMEILSEGKKKFNFDKKDDKDDDKKSDKSDKDQDDEDDDKQDDGEKVSSRAKGRKRVMDEAKNVIEETEINELSRKTLTSYVSKSKKDSDRVYKNRDAATLRNPNSKTVDKHTKTLKKRGLGRALANAKNAKSLGLKPNEWGKNPTKISATEETVNETYNEVQELYIDKLVEIRDELHTLLGKLIGEHEAACSAQEKITAMHQAGRKPNEALYKKTHGKIYDAKYLLRDLETARDAVLSKCQSVKEGFDSPVETAEAPVREAMETAGAVPGEKLDSKWSKGAKRFVKAHVIKFDVDGEGAANDTAASIRNSMTKGKPRPGDQTRQDQIDALKV